MGGRGGVPIRSELVSCFRTLCIGLGQFVQIRNKG